jgi:hypothetical protein
MEMTKALAGVLAGGFVLAMVAAAGAGIPDATQSYVTLTGDVGSGAKGLVTCPAGDYLPFRFVTVTALTRGAAPIVGIPSGNFFFTATGTGGGNVSFNVTSVPPETDINGQIQFEAQGDGTVPYGSLTITVQIYTVALSDSDILWCNTFDFDNDNDVDPVDFSDFASYFGTTDEHADYDWDGDVDPVDFAEFAGHFGH